MPLPQKPLSRSLTAICLAVLLVTIIYLVYPFFFIEVSDGEGWHGYSLTTIKMNSVIDKAHEYYMQHQVFPEPSDLDLSEEKLDGWGREFIFDRVAEKGRYFFKIQKRTKNPAKFYFLNYFTN